MKVNLGEYLDDGNEHVSVVEETEKVTIMTDEENLVRIERVLGNLGIPGLIIRETRHGLDVFGGDGSLTMLKFVLNMELGFPNAAETVRTTEAGSLSPYIDPVDKDLKVPWEAINRSDLELLLAMNWY